jgi:hypothetical protein
MLTVYKVTQQYMDDLLKIVEEYSRKHQVLDVKITPDNRTSLTHRFKLTIKYYE